MKLPESLLGWLEAEAQRAGQPKSTLVRQILQEYQQSLLHLDQLFDVFLPPGRLAQSGEELETCLIACNLLRALMVQAGGRHGVPVNRLGFKGTVDAGWQCRIGIAQARSQKE